MKKTSAFKTVLAVAAILSASNLFAQDAPAEGKGAYVSFGAGYGFKSNAQSFSENDFVNSVSVGNKTTYTQSNISLGKGLNIGGAVGYMFNPNVGMEVGLSYLLGGKNKALQTDTDETYEQTLSANMLRFTPAIVLSAGSDKKTAPYAKFGAVLGMGSIKYGTISKEGSSEDVQKVKLNGGLALGFTSSLGVAFKMGGKSSFFTELNLVGMSYAPTKGELVEYTSDGKDELPGLPVQYKETKYVKEYDSSKNIPSTEPNEELRQKMPFGSVGINFGLRIGL